MPLEEETPGLSQEPAMQISRGRVCPARVRHSLSMFEEECGGRRGRATGQEEALEVQSEELGSWIMRSWTSQQTRLAQTFRLDDLPYLWIICWAWAACWARHMPILTTAQWIPDYQDSLGSAAVTDSSTQRWDLKHTGLLLAPAMWSCIAGLAGGSGTNIGLSDIAIWGASSGGAIRSSLLETSTDNSWARTHSMAVTMRRAESLCPGAGKLETSS